MGFSELLTCSVQPYPTLFKPLSRESSFAAMLNPAETSGNPLEEPKAGAAAAPQHPHANKHRSAQEGLRKRRADLL